jgi:uncharacterized membrane protein
MSETKLAEEDSGSGSRSPADRLNNAPVSRQATPALFGRLSILVLSIDWTVFGSMHFAFRDETIQMIPNWIPYKPLVATTTGIIEVAIGILILLHATRRWAALVSLALLIAYIPAVYHMLAYDPALAGNSLAATAFRVALVPHNIFLAICSVYLLRNPDTSLFATTANSKAP